MGLNLRLLPEYTNKACCDFSHDILETDQDYKLYDIINETITAIGRDVREDGLNCYVSKEKDGESAYGKIKDDEYGKGLTYLFAKDLFEIFKDHKHDYWRNESIQAFLMYCPKDLKIYLHWH